MKAVDLTEDTLEDLLAYDDLFLDYFNAFLQLPAFAEPLEYDRLIGSFQEVQPTKGAGSSTLPPTSALSRSALGSRSEKRYGVSDEEREAMLEWCKNNRLPFFLETKLFRELKLLKLLLRTLEDRFQSSASHRSSQIRGYSRQTESYVSSLSNSADNSANEDDYDEEWSGDSTERYGDRIDQPASRALSLPNRLAGEAHSATSDKMGLSSTRRQTGRNTRNKKVLFAQKREASEMFSDSGIDASQEGKMPLLSPTRQAHFFSIDENGVKTEKKPPVSSEDGLSKPVRSISAPVNYKEFLHIPMYTDFTDIFLNDEGEELDGEKFVSYNEDKVSEQQTESDIKNLEGKINMSLQQMKERIFGSMTGMEELKQFLEGTNGMHLFNFWIDCETFKDTMADHDEIMKMASRNQLFRDIQDKYKLSLTADARAQIQKAASSYRLSHTVFIRTQYDVLRRLRTYWLPRFILHKEKANQLNTLLGLHHLNQPTHSEKLDKFSDQFLPKISFVNSLPIDHNRIMQLTNRSAEDWMLVSQGGRKFDASIKSGRPCRPYVHGSVDLKEKMVYALAADRNAGGPFKAYLSKFEKYTLLSKLLFWEAVSDYASAEDRSADRLLRMNQAWNIYNTYIGQNSPRDIDLDRKSMEAIRNTLQASTDFVGVDILDAAKGYAVDNLLQPWTLYLKYDVKLFLDAQAARFGPPEARPRFSLDRISILFDVENPRVIIAKPMMRLREPSASTVTTVVMRRAPLTQSAKEERRQQRLERRKQLIKEQKALLKAVKARQEETKAQRIVSAESSIAKEPSVALVQSRSKAFPVEALPEKKRTRKPRARVPRRKKKDLNAKSRASGEIALGPDGEPIETDEFGEGLYNPKSGISRKSGSYRDEVDERKSARINALLLEKEVEFTDQVKSRPMMSMFKKYLIDNEARDFINAVNLYHEIDVYHKTDNKPKTKKDIQASFIFKTYLDQSSKKAVKVNSEKVKNRLANEKDRPKTATLNETQKVLITVINPMFQQFFEAQAEEFGVEPRVLATMSQAELQMRAETDLSLGGKAPKKTGAGGRNRKEDGEETSQAASDNVAAAVDFASHGRRNKKKQLKRFSSTTSLSTWGTESVFSDTDSFLPPIDEKYIGNGKAPPSKDDKMSFMHGLQESQLSGKPTVQMDHFWKYLIKHGDDDNNPLIDRDLMFYLEVQKYKELTHHFTDEELVKKKCQAIVDCFLESSIQPSCQIDISSDMCNRIVKNAVKVMQGKEVIQNLFDEAQFIVFKELLPYWAGFLKTYKPPEDPSKVPLSKRQKALQKRYEEFQSAVVPVTDRVVLPVIKNPANMHALKISSLTYSITDGLKVKDADAEDIPPAYLKTEEEVPETAEGKIRAHQLKYIQAAKNRRPSVITHSSLTSSNKDLPASIQEVS